MFYDRSVNDFIYVAGQMNVENLAGNQFVNFALVAFTELPSVFIGEFLMNRFGRRWCQFFFLSLTTLCYVCIMPICQGKYEKAVIPDNGSMNFKMSPWAGW